jgi:hypothetical protein
MFKLRSTLGCLLFSLLAGQAAPLQPVYFNTSSASLGLNTLASVNTNGSGTAILFTATGPGMNNVSRCTAVAVDGLNGKLFMADGASNTIWRFNLDGTGQALIRPGLTNYPTDLALDVLNQKIYFATSSTIQANNTVQRMDYTSGNNTILFTATGSAANGGNGVSRCTAIAVDPSNSKMFIADAGAGKIWGMNLSGGGLMALATAPANSFPTGLALDTANQQVYFSLSSPVQGSNLIQRVGYGGSGLTTLFTASGGVQRCTALDLDVSHSIIYLSDAGANALWRIPLGGGSPTAVLSGLTATAKKVRWFGGPSSRPPPGITGLNLAGGNATLSATNGYIGGTYYLLSSTNVGLSLSQWLPVATNVLAASGSFSLTDPRPFYRGTPRQFYILQVQ